MLRKDTTAQRDFISPKECFGLTSFPIYVISHISALSCISNILSLLKREAEKTAEQQKKNPRNTPIHPYPPVLLPKESNNKEPHSRNRPFQLPPRSCLRLNGFILGAGRLLLLIASLPSTLPQGCPVHPIHVRRSKWMAESSRVPRLPLWMSLQIRERQEPGETSRRGDRNCKGQPVALTQSGHSGPTCVFVITSRDLPEMKGRAFHCALQSINSFCFAPVLFNQYN